MQASLLRAWLALAFVVVSAAAQDSVRTLTILHTNDLRAHLLPNRDGLGGFAELATALRREREHCSDCLYLNAGDLVQGTPVSTLFHGLPIYEIANRLGIDASTLGNHEFDYGYGMIPQFLRIARFPVVSANVVDGNGRLVAQPYIIKTVGGLRVAVIGAVMGNLVGTYTTAAEIGPWRVLPLLETVRKVAAEVAPRCDLVVLLAHIEDDEVDQILSNVPEVPVIIAGHGHRGYPEMKQNQGRVAVEGKGYGVELNRLELSFDTAHRIVTAAKWKRIPVEAKTFPPAPDVADLISTWEAKVSKVVDVPIGFANRPLAREDLQKLVERAMAEETGADFAWINRGNLRESLPAGKLLARHVWDVLPFDNRVLVGTFKGRALPAKITQGRNVDPDKEYKLAVTDFTAANQASQLGTSELVFSKSGPWQRDLVIEWIRKKKVLE
jgi:5'-nucleotidase/UDP-sugar diphosphatase